MALAIVQIWFGWVLGAYYRFWERPTLLERGARACQDYRAVVAGEQPQNCDVVLARPSGAALVEEYYTAKGQSRRSVTSLDGEHRSTHTEFRAQKLAMLFPAVGIVALWALIGFRAYRLRGRGFLREPLMWSEGLVLAYSIQSVAITLFAIG
jgi:hypothetical protein